MPRKFNANDEHGAAAVVAGELPQAHTRKFNSLNSLTGQRRLWLVRPAMDWGRGQDS
jgi:hypothetical protein